MDVLDHALEMAEIGFRVFPLRHPDGPDPKKPAIKWVRGASSDPATIREWFSGEFKGHGYGIACGDGFVVLDADCKPDKKTGIRAPGLQSLDLAAAIGLDPFMVVSTPSGGRHAFARLPPDTYANNSQASTSRLAREFPGVDVRGDGGYVVGPGSRGYLLIERKDRDSAAVVDKDMLALMQAGHAPRVHEPKPIACPLDQPHAIERARGYLSLTEPAIEGEGGDPRTIRVANNCLDWGLSTDTLLDLMLDWNERCSPSWDIDELETKIISASKSRHHAIGCCDSSVEFDALDFDLGERPSAPGLYDTAEVVPTSPEKRNRLYLLDFDEAADLALAQGNPSLIENVIDQHSFAVLYGPSNSGKTFLAMLFGYHVSMGLDWDGHRTTQGAVVYVAAEGGRGINKRVAALRQHFQPTTRPPFALVPCPVDLRSSDADVKKLVQLIEGATPDLASPKLIVVDTLSRALAGGDENGSVDMGAFVMNIDKLRAATSATVLVVHHTGKNEANGARGWSGLRGAVDTEIEVKEDKDTKRKTIEFVKQRDMEMLPGVGFRLEILNLGAGPEGDHVSSCVLHVVSMAEAEFEAGDIQVSPLAKDYFDCLDEGMVVADWNKSFALWMRENQSPALGDKTVQRLRAELVDAGWIERIGKKPNATVKKADFLTP